MSRRTNGQGKSLQLVITAMPESPARVGDVISFETELDGIGRGSCELHLEYDERLFSPLGATSVSLGPGKHLTTWKLRALGASARSFLAVKSSGECGVQIVLAPVEVV